MTLNGVYDIPDEVRRTAEGGGYSQVFRDFLWNWFGSTKAAANRRVDLSFVDDFTESELSLARDLIRRNLELKYNHILEGTSALHDVTAIPVLRKLLLAETDLSRRLTIAGELWKLDKDPMFVDCLQECRRRKPNLFSFGHLLQVLWLNDKRAVDFLIGLLGEPSVDGYALGLLNELESGHRQLLTPWQLPHQADYYKKNRLDPLFLECMTSAIQRRNAESRYGW